MKKITTITLAIAAFSSAFSQINAYFEGDPVWIVETNCGPPYCLKKESKKYYVNGDTTINSFVYKQIFESGWRQYDLPNIGLINCGESGTYSNAQPSFFLRSADKKIFIRQNNVSDERILYDFNLSVGDTLPITVNNPSPEIIISAVDSIITPVGYRKRFAFTGGNSSGGYIIEGIGSTRGLIESIPAELECNYTLSCFSLMNEAFYPGNASTCLIQTNVDEQNTNDFAVKISPNPFSGETNIYSEEPLNQATLILNDSFGKEVKFNPSVSGHTVTLSRDELPAGLYCLRLMQDGRLLASRKLIITE